MRDLIHFHQLLIVNVSNRIFCFTQLISRFCFQFLVWIRISVHIFKISKLSFSFPYNMKTRMKIVLKQSIQVFLIFVLYTKEGKNPKDWILILGQNKTNKIFLLVGSTMILYYLYLGYYLSIYLSHHMTF